MKKFITGFITGALVFSAVTAFAAVTYEALPASFKVLVNGKEFVSEKPTVVIEGSTYMPLKAIGDALGVSVKWNNELQQVEVGNSAPVAEANQYSRQTPAPLNTVQQYTYKSDFMDDYTVTLRITGVERGEAAWTKIKAANSFNKEAPEGYEYVLAKIAVSCLSVENDAAISIIGSNFTAFSENNEEYEMVFIVEPDPTLSGKLYAGGNTEGYAVYCVSKADKAPKLEFGADYNGKGGIWFSLQ